MADLNIPYLEERKLVKRWQGPWPVLANMVVTLSIFAVTWWIFQDPRGIMRFYTPYAGYNYCRCWLIILIWMATSLISGRSEQEWVHVRIPYRKGWCFRWFPSASRCDDPAFEGILGNFAFAL